jgi:hypothetical protein
MDGHLMPFVIVIIIDHPALPRGRFVSPFGNVMINRGFGAFAPFFTSMSAIVSMGKSAAEQKFNSNSVNKLSLVQLKNRLVTKHLT